MAIVGRLRHRLAEVSAIRVAVFSALPTEPDLSELWTLPLDLAVPKVSGETLSFWLVPEPGKLTPGYRGILEPDERACERVGIDSLDLILVPGLAFGESDGSRLGRGGGFYDRLLSGCGVPRWGICFEEQVRGTIPAGGHDVRMEELITCEREVRVMEK